MCPAYPKKKQDIRLKHAVPLAREATKERLPCDEVATAYRTPPPACLVLIPNLDNKMIHQATASPEIPKAHDITQACNKLMQQYMEEEGRRRAVRALRARRHYAPLSTALIANTGVIFFHEELLGALGFLRSELCSNSSFEIYIPITSF